MNKEEQILMNRFTDLANQAFVRSIPVCTDFLNLYEQTIFNTFAAKNPQLKFMISGGYEMAERKIVCFLPLWAEKSKQFLEEMIQVIKIEFTAPKYAKNYTHRDYLGAIMNLGMDRSKFGDIIVDKKTAFLIGKPTAISYIKEQLLQVGHDLVVVESAKEDELKSALKFDEITGTVSSLRLDSIIGLAFRLSRSKAVGAIQAEKIFVNGRNILQVDYKVKPGDILSFRGMGKVMFKEHLSHTKKEREAILILKYK